VSDWDDDYGETSARFYDAGYATLETLGADVDFYRALARECGGPVLELGCGTGRVLLAVAADGLECAGVDASQAMLDALRAKPGATSVDLVCARMQGFDLRPRRFRLVYSAFRAFQHLLTVDDQLACLARVREHLAPGGTFAFDVFDPRLDKIAEGEMPETEDLRFELEGDEIVRTARGVRHQKEQVMDLEFRYERRRKGRAPESRSVRMSMRWFFRYELEHLMARAGFVDVAIHGDFDRSPIAPGSPSFVVVAR
jgi:SAM-dependent methyltransferase